jgi:hypothetical protein
MQSAGAVSATRPPLAAMVTAVRSIDGSNVNFPIAVNSKERPGE